MEEEFYCLLKLVSGEEIFSIVSIDYNDNDPVVVLQNPVIMKFINSPSGTHLKVKPWIELVDEDIFVVRMDKIITMTEVKDIKLIDVYHKYNETPNNYTEVTTDGEVKLSTDMGYISSVEESRKKLEDIFKDLKDN